jgi:hypothetical protein
MGHTRLGQIPKSHAWSEVVDSLRPAQRNPVQSQEIAEIAASTLRAAEGGLRHAIVDKGLAQTFYLLTQLVLTSRQTNWSDSLRDLGIILKPTDSAFELAKEFQRAIDDYLLAKNLGSDISEIAQKAAGEALCELIAPRADTLFGNTGLELQNAVRGLSTKKGFGLLGQKFFGRLLTHYLNFYLSRVTGSTSSSETLSIRGISQFNQLLALHCDQSAIIVRDFAAEWFSKTEFQRGITPSRAQAFVAVAIKKLQSELASQSTQ